MLLVVDGREKMLPLRRRLLVLLLAYSSFACADGREHAVENKQQAHAQRTQAGTDGERAGLRMHQRGHHDARTSSASAATAACCGGGRGGSRSSAAAAAAAAGQNLPVVVGEEFLEL